MHTLQKILELLSPNERRQAILLLTMIMVMALLDVIGVASIMPFMAVLTNPEIVESNPVLSRIHAALGFTDTHFFLFFLGLVVFTVLLLSLGFKALTTYTLLRFTLFREYSIGRRLVAGYLHQPYEWFLNRHSADIGKSVLSEVKHVIDFAIYPMMILVSQSVVVTALILLLVIVNPALALWVVGVFTTAYGIIYFILRHYLTRIGSERLKANQRRFMVISEAFGGIKDLKVSGLESAFLKRFDRSAEQYAMHQASAQIASQLPRFGLEATAFGGMLLVVMYVFSKGDGLQNVLPILALYAFAGYRLMPALQQIYHSLSLLRFGGTAVDSLHRDLVSLSPYPNVSQPVVKMVLNDEIILENIRYSYPGASEPALSELSMAIRARTTVGIVGATGSGKTTAADVILGLLEPQKGALKIDGTPILGENRRAWQKTIGYVPQHIYLIDDTIAANIAYGEPRGQIDRIAVERVARIAELYDFVIQELPLGYDTVVGERGVRLSGGQRQRIGIARALYHGPQVLILDEATSALDGLTEQAVMDAVHHLGHEITIIMIAHRLASVRQCDQIYLLDHGRVVDQGTYQELLARSAKFRALATATAGAG